MSQSGNSVQRTGKPKVRLVAIIDQRALPALDRLAKAYGVNTAQFMSQFFEDVSDAVEFLDSAQDDTWATVEDWLAKRIIQRCCGATPEELRDVGHIWDRAAELKAQLGGDKG